MSGRRGWRLDDWMRPNVRGRYPAPRDVTPKMRRETATMVVVLLGIAASLALLADGYWRGTGPFFFMIMAIPHVVMLFRSRRVGWRDPT